MLLSHEHHFDNLDRAVPRYGTLRLDCHERWPSAGVSEKAVGLAAWESYDTPTPDHRLLRITATPARHGPSDGDRGPVIGFILGFADDPEPLVYISGDTVWYEGIVEIGRRFQPRVAMLFAGAARVREVGPAHLTLTAVEAVEAARLFPETLIVRPCTMKGGRTSPNRAQTSSRRSMKRQSPIDCVGCRRAVALTWTFDKGAMCAGGQPST